MSVGTKEAELGLIKHLEQLVERTILARRWILVVLYIILAASLAGYAIAVIAKLCHLVQEIFTLGEDEIILAMLGLIDASLVAGSLTYRKWPDRFSFFSWQVRASMRFLRQSSTTERR